MMTSFSLWLNLKSRVNTSQNGWFRPETDFIQGLNVISVDKWNKYTNEAEKSQEAKDKLFPFLKSKNVIVNTTSTYYGIAKKPVDYGRFASARIVVHKDLTIPAKDIDDGKFEGWKTDEEIKDEYWDNIKEFPVTMVDNQKWGAYCQHLTKGPTLEKPGITQVNDEFKVAPRKVSVIAIDYYIEPTPATFKYTTSPGNPQNGSGDQLIYDTSSVPLQWPEQMREEFVEDLVKWYMLYTRDQIGNSIDLSQKQVKP